MLYEIEPSRKITGGAWYSEQEFDSEFIEMLQKQCFNFIYSKVISFFFFLFIFFSFPFFSKIK